MNKVRLLSIIFKRSLLNPFFKNKDHTFLFILSPAYSGSTLLTKIITSSRSVSCNNHHGSMEGQFIPKVKKIMREDPWNEKFKMPWEYIKSVWINNWDLSKPILLEKSPPNLVRALDIQNHFSNSYFIINIRNPYAYVHSLKERNNMSVSYAAKFWLKQARFQKKNFERLEKSILVRYEDITKNPHKEMEKLTKFLPELAPIKTQEKYNIHNLSSKKKLPIKNLNQRKIKKLSKDEIAEINKVIKKHIRLLKYFKYQLI